MTIVVIFMARPWIRFTFSLNSVDANLKKHQQTRFMRTFFALQLVWQHVFQ